jgi:type II secretory pathway component GspD/PulD (secretin)
VVGTSISGNNFSGDVTASLDRIASKTNLIARPNMVAMDGKQCEIFVGDIVRYIESETTSQNGPTITTGEVPVGVRLSILARVGAEGNLTLDLRPRVSILDSFTQVPGGGELPQTSSRMSQSTISVKSGETIAIGGLIQDQDVKNISGIPFLMDLPFLGHLFKSSQLSKQRTEVVFFLTAREIDGPLQAEKVLPMQKEEDKNKGGSH